MILRVRMVLVLVVGMAGAFCASPVHADGNVRCDSGDPGQWKSIAQVRKKAWQEGWTVLRAQVQGDCYEVYARTEDGQSIEAFFHPVTLQKLVVYRRGREIYRAEGFDPR